MRQFIQPALRIDQIAQALEPFGVQLSEQQLQAIQKHISLLLIWNQSISLTAIEEPTEIVVRHFGESLFAGKVLQLQSGRLADVGTGAGFPGLALKIAFPGLSIALLEPNGKKCAFLNEVKGALDLQDLEVVRTRFEEYRASGIIFDVICSRALGNYRHLLQWAEASLRVGGVIALWLGTEDSLLLERTKGWIWDSPAKIPGSRRRVILCGRPDRR